jgi:tRNA(Arg) A34 adenosine deaminase TadA
MKKYLFLVLLSFLHQIHSFAQQRQLPQDSLSNSYFVTGSRQEWMQKVAALEIGINPDDSTPIVIRKLESYVNSYQPDAQYPDDIYAKESILQTIEGFKEGGYGIGAVLVDSDGKIIAKNHNSQIQKHRSDLHAEMTLLTAFEVSPKAKKYMNVFVYKPGLTVYSSAEPCPMCLIRLAAAEVKTKYCCPGPDDGMANRIDCLPSSWRDLAHKYPCEKAQSSPQLQKIAHLMFFSFLLDNRGPK